MAIDFDGTEIEGISDDDLAGFDALVNMIGNKLAKSRTYVLNPKRLKEIEQAYKTLRQIVFPVCPDAKFECRMHELFDGNAVIRIHMDELIVEDVKKFIQGVVHADNFEIYTIGKNRIKMALMFYGVMEEVSEE